MKRLAIAVCFIISLITLNAKDMDGIIDVHSHIITPEYLDCLRRHDALMEDGYPLPEWSDKSHLEFMDGMGIAKSVLTLSSPQPWFGDADESKSVIRSVNEAMADAKRHFPDRFLWCAALPQPDVNAAVDEAIYALDTLKADGIKLATNVKTMCRKEPMQPDGIVRLSKVEVYPEYLEEYMTYAMAVGETSLLTEPGVLTMYAVADKENPNIITILETYSSQDAYKSHIASPHFQKYKQGTLHMVKNLVLDDVNPLNPRNQITNTIIE